MYTPALLIVYIMVVVFLVLAVVRWVREGSARNSGESPGASGATTPVLNGLAYNGAQVAAYWRTPLSPLVEPELRSPPPRPEGQVHCEGMRKGDYDWIASGCAVRGVVVSAEHVQSRESIDVRASYTYSVDKKPFEGKFDQSFDPFHFAVFSRGYSSWVDRALKPGRRATVLYRPESPADHVLYGELRPRVRTRPLQVIADELGRQDLHALERQRLAAELEEMLGLTLENLAIKDFEQFVRESNRPREWCEGKAKEKSDVRDEEIAEAVSRLAKRDLTKAWLSALREPEFFANRRPEELEPLFRLFDRLGTVWHWAAW